MVPTPRGDMKGAEEGCAWAVGSGLRRAAFCLPCPFACRLFALGLLALRLRAACRPLIVTLALACLFLRLCPRLRIGDAAVTFSMFPARAAERANASGLASQIGDETIRHLDVLARTAFLREVALGRARGCLTQLSV